ncbi:MAG: BlaI/MecI/CopY family transcriptional regulator [Bacteroidota bacterium]
MKKKPTDSELEILQVLWTQGSATVRQVNDQLNKHRQVGYTTTLKIMQIMYDKRMVSRVREGKTHIYRAEVEQSEAQKHLIDKLLDTAFQGSATQLVMQALGGRDTSQEEIDEIRRFLDGLDDEE